MNVYTVEQLKLQDRAERVEVAHRMHRSECFLTGEPCEQLSCLRCSLYRRWLKPGRHRW